MSINKAAGLLMIGAIAFILYSIIYLGSEIVTFTNLESSTMLTIILMSLLELAAGIGMLIFAIAVKNNFAEILMSDGEIVQTADEMP